MEGTFRSPSCRIFNRLRNLVTANSRIAAAATSSPDARGRSRAPGIHDLLTLRRKLSADDFLEIQGDITRSPGALPEEVHRLPDGRPRAADPQWRDTLASLDSGTPDRATPSSASGESVLSASEKFSKGGRPDRAKQDRWPSSANFVDAIIEGRPRAAEGMKSYADCSTRSQRGARELTKRSPGRITMDLGEDQLARFRTRSRASPSSRSFLTAFPAVGAGSWRLRTSLGSRFVSSRRRRL